MNTHDQHRPPDLDKVLAGAPHHEAVRLREVWDLAGREEATDFPNAVAIERVWQSLENFAASNEGVASVEVSGSQRILPSRT